MDEKETFGRPHQTDFTVKAEVQQAKKKHPSPSLAIMNQYLIATPRGFTKESVMAITVTNMMADVTLTPHLMIKQQSARFTGGFFWKTISHHSHQLRSTVPVGIWQASLLSFFHLSFRGTG